jgi:hypothetical protein
VSALVYLSSCQWKEPGGLAMARQIAEFLSGIGITVEPAPIDGPMFLAGLEIAGNSIRVDPATPTAPGDLLHEAGHIAVTEPDRRAALATLEVEPGEEMAAIAWSVAAAKACNVPLDVLFHPDGYKGDSEWLADGFGSGTPPFGTPLLVWYGMTSNEMWPAMSRWLR